MIFRHAGEKESLNFEEGEIILVDKPIDWTSFDIVARIRSMFEIKKLGHAGTLDPKATGLLVLCSGKMTKQIDQFIGWEKEYTGTMEIGATTKSFDVETEVDVRKDFSAVQETDVEQVFRSFLGQQQQLPPMYSAIKKNGRRLYKDARKGKTVEREKRDVFIKEFALVSFLPPMVQFRVVCSKGTYIRSLVNDAGQLLGCGAYMTQLCRTRIGNFHLHDALPVTRIHELGKKISPAAVEMV